MKRILKFITENAQKIRNISLFILTAVILIFLFPREGRFRYEFQKGKPWMHEGYIAPFNFPIYKSEESLAYERDSILRDFKPYFRKEISIGEEMMKKLSRSFNKRWEEMIQQAYRDMPDSLQDKELINMHRELLKEYLAGKLAHVYQRGIVENNDIPERVTNPDRSLVILTDRVADERQVSEVFTQKAA